MSVTVPTELAVFGPCVVETDIDEAIIGALRKWLPTYLAQMGRERGIQPPAAPNGASVTNALTDAEFPDHALPAVIVTTVRTENEPHIYQDDSYAAEWVVVVSSIYRGSTPPQTRTLASLMNGTVRRIMQAQLAKDPVIGECRWMGSSLQPVADRTGRGRYLAAGVNTFRVRVDDVVGEGVGPVTPDINYAPLATISEVTVDIEPKGA